MRTVLGLQGSNVLGAYQAGVVDATERMGLTPIWVISTGVGAVNAALIAGNTPERRLEHVYEFWARLSQSWHRSGADQAT